MKICPVCGKENEDPATVCLDCGAPLPQPEPVPQEEAFAPLQEEPVEPETPKKSKKGLWIGLTCVLVAVAAVVVCMVLMNNPTSRVTKAFAKTGKALEQQVSQMENLGAAYDSFAAIRESGQMTETCSLSTTGFLEMYFNVEADADMVGKVMAIDFAVGVADTGEIRMGGSIAPDGIRIAMPQLLPEKVLNVSGQELSELMNDMLEEEAFPEDFLEELFQTADTETQEEVTQSLLDYVKSMKATALLPREPEDWTFYAITPDAEKKQALLDSLEALYRPYMELQQTLAADEPNSIAELITYLEELDDPVVAVNQQGYLVCVELTHPEKGTISIRLTGGENPWSSYELWDKNGLRFSGEFQVTDGLLTLTGATEDGSGSFRFTCDDKTGDYSFYFEDEYSKTEMTGTWTVQDGAVTITLDAQPDSLNDAMTFAITIAPLAKAPQVPQGEEIAIMQLTDEELGDLNTEMQKNMLADEEIMGLLYYFLGGF